MGIEHLAYGESPCSPRYGKVRDYLELIKVTAEIYAMVHDSFNDPFAQRASARKKRVDFERLKRSKGFQAWRSRQMKVQQGQCAWCRTDILHANVVVHIDHVSPLFHFGTNNHDNLVLSCRRCNLRKWTSDRYVVPDWIKESDAKMRSAQRLRDMRRNQERTMRDAIIEDELSWLIGS